MKETNISRTLVIIKPGVFEQDLDPKLLRMFQAFGLSVICKYWIKFDLDSLRRFYQWDYIIHPNELEKYLCSQPLRLFILEGKDAIENALKIRKIFRDRYATGWRNLLHCPDSTAEFFRELEFCKKELINEENQQDRQSG